MAFCSFRYFSRSGRRCHTRGQAERHCRPRPRLARINAVERSKCLDELESHPNTVGFCQAGRYTRAVVANRDTDARSVDIGDYIRNPDGLVGIRVLDNIGSRLGCGQPDVYEDVGGKAHFARELGENRSCPVAVSTTTGRANPLHAPAGHVAPDEERKHNDRKDDENSDKHAMSPCSQSCIDRIPGSRVLQPEVTCRSTRARSHRALRAGRGRGGTLAVEPYGVTCSAARLASRGDRGDCVRHGLMGRITVPTSASTRLEKLPRGATRANEPC